MPRLNPKAFVMITILSFIVFACWASTVSAETSGASEAAESPAAPLILMTPPELAGNLDRPPTAFDHDRHTAALKTNSLESCGVCHPASNKDATVGAATLLKTFTFPKAPYDASDKMATATAYHNECVGCHRKLSSEGKKSGPDVGLCGKCHVRRTEPPQTAQAWTPLFNYRRHFQHTKASETWPTSGKSLTGIKVDVLNSAADTRCYVCHHSYDETTKKLIYQKNTENACAACHKHTDQKNVRSMQKVAHAACIGCHAKLREEAKIALVGGTATQQAAQSSKRFGPVECKGCHTEHAKLSPAEIAKIPRLERGQKDVMDLPPVPEQEFASANTPTIPLVKTSSARMKVVPFNHKAHEPRAQFCSTCHHHSMEKCSNCHTLQSNLEKGGGITLHQAFHKVSAKQSCTGCHDNAKQDQQCRGCHQVAQQQLSNESCRVCHRGPSEGAPPNAPPAPIVFNKDDVPEKLELKTLDKEFKPTAFPHQKIVIKLTKLSNDNALARVFHAGLGEQTMCKGCHHRTEPAAAQAKMVPKCMSCHTKGIDPNDPSKPGIPGAYHRQCMSCHEAMKQPPAPLQCTKCHERKEQPVGEPKAASNPVNLESNEK